MIIYQDNVGNFISQCFGKWPGINDISDLVSKEMVLHGISYFDKSQVRAWKASLPEMAKVLEASYIDRAVTVAIEYKPSISKDRIDFLICGTDVFGNKNVVVVELKQWSDASKSNKKDYVFVTGDKRGPTDHWHPSCQAKNYINIIKNFNEYIQEEHVNMNACSYLHNMPEDLKGFLDNETYFPLVKTSPAFLREDMDKLREFIEKYVSKPYKSKEGLSLLFEIDNSRLRPSDSLASSLDASLKGNDFFSYDEHQSNAVETIIEEVRKAKFYNQKKTIIIKGGPGSGKSVVAINVLGRLIGGEISKGKRKDKLTSVYVTSNASPKNLYKKELIRGDYKKNFLRELFKEPSSFQNSKENDFDCILVDEAHRVYNYAAGSHGISKKGPNAIELLIKASLVTVFFLDDDQKVTVFDYGTRENIKKAAYKYRSEVIESHSLELTSEFRCLGGEDYMNFIRFFLGYPNGQSVYTKNEKKYDFRIFDSAYDMMEEIAKKDLEEQESFDKKQTLPSSREMSGKCRLVAGYTYNWVSKGEERSGPTTDINLDLDSSKPFRAKWNLYGTSLGTDYSWLDDPKSTYEVGCIHTCQGLDMPYCGVIIGKDLTYNKETKQIEFHPEEDAKTDTASGIHNKNTPLTVAKELIRNTYHVLLTRGIKGTYVYAEDKALSEYLKSLVK